MKIRKGLWYLCRKDHERWSKGYWYYSPCDGYLNGNDDNPHRVKGFVRLLFSGGEEIKIRKQ